jgi:hypothetical protein
MDKMAAENRLAGGMPLTLNGKAVRGKERIIRGSGKAPCSSTLLT